MRVVQVVEGFDQFTVQEIDAPKFCKDGAIMQMEAALVASYMAALPSGAWMTPLRPFITGQCAVGVVEQSSGIIQQGQRVFLRHILVFPLGFFQWLQRLLRIPVKVFATLPRQVRVLCR